MLIKHVSIANWFQPLLNEMVETTSKVEVRSFPDWLPKIINFKFLNNVNKTCVNC
jgi:hypothetical protein